MEANQSRKRWTYAEYARLPISGTTRYEVIAGELAVTPSPTSGHQEVVGNLLRVLGGFVHEHALGKLLPGPIDVLFGEGDYLQPDLAFVRRDRQELVSERGIEGPPDLIVEILSLSTHRDRGIKLERYRHFAVAEYWIVDIEERTVEVWALSAGSDERRVASSHEAIRWTPLPGGPTLDLRVADILPDA